jgi:uncharacterized cupin superfamily protein
MANPAARVAADIAPRTKPSNYPPEFAQRVAARVKRQIGDAFGLKNFGVNLTHLPPGAISALRHAHTKQDEFVYVLQGTATLVTDARETTLTAGMCAGFPAGEGNAHQLVNRSQEMVVYLEVGDRTPGDSASYPDDDLVANLAPSGWVFTRKDGTPY